MRIKKIKFGNDPSIHFIVGIDLNRIEISIFGKNPKTLVNEVRLKKEYYIIEDDETIDTESKKTFIKKNDIVIVDLIYDLYLEYAKLQKIETDVWNMQLENTGYIEFKNEEYNEEEKDYS